MLVKNMEKNNILKEESILYKLKAIDKLVVRNLTSKFDILNFNTKLENMPSRSQLEIVHYILEHINEEVYQKDLERALNLRRATISGILGTMEKNGFIERTIDDKDTRVKKITLSNKALDRYYKGKEYIEHIENTVLKGISDEELKVFNNVLEKMTLNLKTNT